MIGLGMLLTVILQKNGGAMSGYDISKMVKDTTKHSHQQVYRELHRLLEKGDVTAKHAPQTGKPDRILYTYARKGTLSIPETSGSDFSKTSLAYILAARDVCNGTNEFHRYIEALDAAEADFIKG